MSIEALRQLEGLDVDQGLVNCMDDEGLFLSVVGMYIDQIKEYLSPLNEHYQSENFEEYGKLAHSIKGASASVGAHVVQAQSLELEQAARLENFAPIKAQHNTYFALLEQTVSELEQAVS